MENISAHYYIVIVGNSLTTIRENVEMALKKGWKCQGGISVTVNQGQFDYYQAMIL